MGHGKSANYERRTVQQKPYDLREYNMGPKKLGAEMQPVHVEGITQILDHYLTTKYGLGVRKLELQ